MGLGKRVIVDVVLDDIGNELWGVSLLWEELVVSISFEVIRKEVEVLGKSKLR